MFFPKQSFDHPDGKCIPSQKIMKKKLVSMDSDCVLQKGCSSTTYTYIILLGGLEHVFPFSWE